MAKWERFERPCPKCGLNWATDEGDRGCGWAECPYLPEELDVHCEQCRFNYFTMEGNPPCPDPMACDHSVTPLRNVENYKRWLALRGQMAQAAE